MTTQVPTGQAPQNCDRSDGGQEEGVAPSITRNTHFPGSAAGTDSLRWHHACFTVTAQMRLLWGNAGSSYLGVTERTFGGKRDCRDRQQPTHLARHSSASSARLPTFTGSVPSPSQRRRLDGLPVSPLPQPTSVLLSLFLSSNSHLSLQLPESAASPARHQPARASFRQGHCHCSGALFCRAGCLHPQLPPHTLQEDAQSCVEPAEDNSVAPPPLTTAAAHSPPEKAKPKACTPWGSPFFSTVECRGKPGLSRPYQLEKPLCTVWRVHQWCFTALGSETHIKDAYATDEVMCLPYYHHAWKTPMASQDIPFHAFSWGNSELGHGMYTSLTHSLIAQFPVLDEVCPPRLAFLVKVCQPRW